MSRGGVCPGESLTLSTARPPTGIFSQWHYRSHHLAFTRNIIVAEAPWRFRSASAFRRPRGSLTLALAVLRPPNLARGSPLTALNQQLWLLSVWWPAPHLRGAGWLRVSSAWLRYVPGAVGSSAQLMGRINPFFDKAAQRVGVIRNRKKKASAAVRESRRIRHSEACYYVLDTARRIKLCTFCLESWQACLPIGFIQMRFDGQQNSWQSSAAEAGVPSPEMHSFVSRCARTRHSPAVCRSPAVDTVTWYFLPPFPRLC